jgi:general secretion pathway protein A
MYTQFYGLREKPFSLSPDPRYLFLADSHREALAHLLYGIEQGEGFIAITGEVGTGKTTLCRTLLQRIEPGTEVAFIFNPQLSALELLQAISAELDLETGDRTRRELTDQLNHFLLTKREEDHRVLLIIDEAQNLAPDALEQVRLLSNLETNTAKLIQIILIGQPELDTILEQPSLRQLCQRISVRWRLAPLSTNETREYIRHRLRIAAGAPRDLFTELAMREIHRRSQGIPRVINLLCDRALLAGYAASAKAIGLGLVTQTQKELRGGARAIAASRFSPRLDGLVPPSLRRVAPAAALIALGILAGVAWQSLSGGASVGPTSEHPRVSAPPPQFAESLSDLEPGPVLQAPGNLTAPDEEFAEEFAAAPDPGEIVGEERADFPEFTVEPVRAAPIPGAAAESARTAAIAAPAPEPSTRLPRADLATALARSSPAVTTATSLNALLDIWGEAPTPSELMSLSQALAILKSRDLAVMPLRGASLATLQLFNYPAILELSALDGMPRFVLLTGLEGEDALITGIGDGLPLRVPFVQVEHHWGGDAWVAWRDFEDLPEILRPPLRGASVIWLQQALGRMGFYDGALTGELDAATITGVRDLQASLQIQVDGTVGRVTKIRLYERLGLYAVPRLQGRDEVTG